MYNDLVTLKKCLSLVVLFAKPILSTALRLSDTGYCDKTCSGLCIGNTGFNETDLIVYCEYAQLNCICDFRGLSSHDWSRHYGKISATVFLVILSFCGWVCYHFNLFGIRDIPAGGLPTHQMPPSAPPNNTQPKNDQPPAYISPPSFNECFI